MILKSLGLKKSPTTFVVGGSIGIGLIYTAFALWGMRWGLTTLFYCLYEGWTFFNDFANDTISEIIWVLSKRPLVPAVFGIAVGVGVGLGYFGPWQNALTCIIVGGLLGHFFWQKAED